MVIAGRIKSMTEAARLNVSDGAAALGICESLLLALTHLKIMSDKDVENVLMDVVNAHVEAARLSLTPENHEAVITILKSILSGRNGVRH
jgi:hypothetical protein